VEATEPVTVDVPDDDPEDDEPEDEPEDPEPEPLPPEPLPAAVEVEPVLTFEVLPVLLGATALVEPEASVLEVEVWYPKRSTSAERLLSNHRVMRLMKSPREGLEMELVGWQAGVGEGASDQLGPVLGPADVHVPFGDVGDPVAQRDEVVHLLHGADAVPEPGARRPAMSREVEDVESSLP
jgi:hypothetical protein